MLSWLALAAVSVQPQTAGAPNSASPPTAVYSLDERTRWAAAMPPRWNGTLLLYSRGYSPAPGKPEPGSPAQRQALLAAGYAIAASDYGSGGWALEQALPAQRRTISAFAAQYGKPRRVIAWGSSMGGLVTTALAEQPGSGIDGALAVCASIGGSLGMMNMALNGAYAFRTLVAPNAGIQLVGIKDDRANGQRVSAALAEAIRSPGGRARVALAGVLAGIPSWTSPDKPRPADSDIEAQAAEISRSFVMGVFLPRSDQEQRAGGVFSWNDGVDYRGQLTASGRRPLVEALYRRAGLDLDRDLAALNRAERVRADPAAVAYMRAHYAPNARPLVPLVALQTIGDGLTSPTMQRAYADVAGPARVRSLFVNQAGHCTAPGNAVLAAIQMVEARISTGRWSAPAPGVFTPYRPTPMLRSCFRNRRCS